MLLPTTLLRASNSSNVQPNKRSTCHACSPYVFHNTFISLFYCGVGLIPLPLMWKKRFFPRKNKVNGLHGRGGYYTTVPKKRWPDRRYNLLYRWRVGRYKPTPTDTSHRYKSRYNRGNLVKILLTRSLQSWLTAVPLLQHHPSPPVLKGHH